MNLKPVRPGSATTTRRRFLQTTAATIGAAFVPFSIRANHKSGSNSPLVGAGEHTYEVMHDWGHLPAGCRLGNTHGVAEDSQDRIYIKQTVGQGSSCEDAVLVFDSDGTFINSWGHDFKGGAHGLQLSRENGREFFYLCDTRRRLVIKTTLDGEEVWRRGVDACGDIYNDPKRFCPTNVAVGGETVFVADGYGSNYIHRFDLDGGYLGTFGGGGSAPGQLSCPHGLMVDTRGAKPELVVADRGNRRLQYFTLEGVHIRFVSDELRAPCHFDERQGVLLIPDLESRVTLFDRNNQLITHLGDGGHYKGIRDQAREAFKNGKFVAPHSACFDHAGNIFVVEWVEVGRITKLRRV